MAIRAGLLALALCSPALADVVREGSGPRREALNAMELAPFDSGLWSKVSSWTAGAPDPSKTSGNVVLICTWSSWYDPSLRQGLAIAQRLSAKHADKGLIVVGVHHPEGWSEAAAAAEKLGVGFTFGHDAKGEFRSALKVDQDPDFYVVDRAGHLRYADVATASVEQAVAELIAETREAASDLPKLLKEKSAKERASAAQNTTIRTDIELDRLPPVPPGYEQPDEEAYKNARWPQMTREEAQRWGMLDPQGSRQDKTLTFTPEAWFPREPALEGRAYVLYWWHPDLPRSYSVLGQMDALQATYVRDLVVIGALTPFNNLDNSRQGMTGQQGETVEDLERKLRAFQNARHYNHTLAADFGATAVLSISAQGAGGQFPVPGAMLVSSDGVIRWVGPADSSRFQSAVSGLLLADPGVRNRREADRKFIESGK